MKLNQRGFGSPMLYIYAAIGVIIIGLCVAIYIQGLRNKVLRVEIKSLKVEVNTLTIANDGLFNNLEKERKANTKALKFYQDKLNECINNQKPCEIVVVPNCPTFKVIDKGDETLIMLQQIWR